MTRLPPYLTTAQVAKACDMSTEKARRMLARAGILERIGGRWVVSDSRLNERLPEVYTRAFDALVLASRDTHRNAETRRNARPSPTDM